MFVTKYLTFFDVDSSKTLLINSLSGAVDVVPHHLAAALQRVHTKKIPIDFEIEAGTTQYLTERGYLFETRESEEEYLLTLYEKAKEVYAQNPVKFVICPTYSCNLRCTYCYEGDLGIKNNKILNKEQISAIFSAADEIRKDTSISHWLFELFGGEPLLKRTKSIVEHIVATVYNRNDTVAIVTNGTHILDYKNVFKTYTSTVDSVQITLDGPEFIHNKRRLYPNGNGTFNTIVRGIDFLLNQGIHVRLRVNVDKENIQYLPAFITFLERKTWPFYTNFLCDIAPVTYHTRHVRAPHVLREDEAVRIILDMIPDLSLLRKTIHFNMFRVLNHVSSVLEPTRHHISVAPSFHYCEAANLEYYVFGPDNCIYACPDAIVDTKYAVGRYFPEFVLEKEKLQYWKRDILSIPECRRCEVAFFCGGGCGLVSKEHKGNPACNGAKEVLATYLDFWKKSR